MIIVTEEMVSQFKAGFHGSTLNDDQVRRGLASVFLHRGLYDAKAAMADGGDTIMTAAEEVLAWLLIEKIGVPDDVSYTPDQAQEIIVRRLDQVRELEQIDDMLDEGQGDDEGYPIMPEFVKGITTYAKVEACLHLLERRRDALHPPPIPSSGVTEKALRMIAAQALTSEISDGTIVANDLEGAHDAMILRAREALFGIPPSQVSRGPADQIIGQIEELFPNWRSYRDLVDCITCELHELRQRAGERP